MSKLRRHAVAVANASRLVCRQTHLANELAFLCGLLHDLGAALSLIVLADVRPPQRPPPSEMVENAVNDAHADASVLICGLWRLAPEVRRVLAHHHFPVIKRSAQPTRLRRGPR